ncbi:MAG TPA: AraC family transcriptional regulator [Salinimicrobium sp.]|nr:AraC family transcriptional regulator [Salinimicrobium sp.]
MKIFVHALPVNEIIADLAKKFEVPVQDDCGELTIHLPEKAGTGIIRGNTFESGIGFIQYNCTFYEDTELHFTRDLNHPLKFIFCSKGKIDHSFEKDDELHTIEAFQNVIVASSGYNGHVLYFKANEISHISSLEIIRSIFSHRNNYNFLDLGKDMAEVFKDQKAEKAFYYQGHYSIKVADIVEEINSEEFSGFLRSIFVEGKAFEMLSLEIAQYHDDQREDRLPQILRRSDVEKVKITAERIQKELEINHSVDFLAKEAGTNVNKLQDGFKYMFGLTVNKYMQQAKLEAAKEMLISSDYNISQISGMIGLNNRSYFSKIFKEKYGVSPKYFLKNQKDPSDIEEN